MAKLVVGERFEVHAISGYAPTGGGGSARERTSYHVLDSWYCYEAVASFPDKRGQRNPERRLRAATLRAAELNAWHARELAG